MHKNDTRRFMPGGSKRANILSGRHLTNAHLNQKGIIYFRKVESTHNRFDTVDHSIFVLMMLMFGEHSLLHTNVRVPRLRWLSVPLSVGEGRWMGTSQLNSQRPTKTCPFEYRRKLCLTLSHPRDRRARSLCESPGQKELYYLIVRTSMCRQVLTQP